MGSFIGINSRAHLGLCRRGEGRGIQQRHIDLWKSHRDWMPTHKFLGGRNKLYRKKILFPLTKKLWHHNVSFCLIYFQFKQENGLTQGHSDWKLLKKVSFYNEKTKEIFKSDVFWSFSIPMQEIFLAILDCFFLIFKSVGKLMFVHSIRWEMNISVTQHHFLIGALFLSRRRQL